MEGGIDPGGPGHVEVAGGVIEVVTGANRFNVGAVLMPSSRRQFDASQLKRRSCVRQFTSKTLQQVSAVLDAQPEGAVGVGIGQRRKIHRFRAGDHRVSNILEASGVNGRRPRNGGERGTVRRIGGINETGAIATGVVGLRPFDAPVPRALADVGTEAAGSGSSESAAGSDLAGLVDATDASNGAALTTVPGAAAV
ncbi:MAG: hypothetical protein EBY51_09540, partial [Actinobacteria bacterium]|nr:hypothetical protein [Actinomycetota bacterium]